MRNVQGKLTEDIPIKLSSYSNCNLAAKIVSYKIREYHLRSTSYESVYEAGLLISHIYALEVV